MYGFGKIAAIELPRSAWAPTTGCKVLLISPVPTLGGTGLIVTNDRYSRRWDSRTRPQAASHLKHFRNRKLSVASGPHQREKSQVQSQHAIATFFIRPPSSREAAPRGLYERQFSVQSVDSR